MAGVPRRFPNSTVICLGSGPSLTPTDVDFCRDKGVVIAINNAIQLAPFADVLYACDRRWWEQHPETAAFTGLKFGLERMRTREDVQILERAGDRGLELDPTAVRTGKNSGYQAVNVAVHLGAARIVLLGYDMQPGAGGRVHFFGDHAWRHGDQTPPFAMFLDHFASLVEPLRQLGVSIVNCTRSTALRCFPQASLEEVFA